MRHAAIDAPDVREGGRWSIAQRAKNDVLFAAASVALALSRRLPRGLLRRLGVGLARVARVVWPAARRTAERNVARAFPELDAEARSDLVRRAYRTLGEHLGDLVAMLDASAPLEPLPFDEAARRVFDDAIAEGHGVLFASAHLGPWERVAATLAASGLPLVVVTREPYDPRFAPLFERLRGGRGVRAIARGAPGAAASLLRTLRRGEVLGIPMDLASRVPSVEVPFLGVPAPTPVGPARLALRTGAAVVVGTVAPGRAGTLAITATRIDTSDLGGAAAHERGQSERELSARINAELARRIRALPASWVWMHDRWPTL